MSLDCDASHMQTFCPNCGNKLFISVSQVNDILNERKEIRQSKVKYTKDVVVLNDHTGSEDVHEGLSMFASLMIAAAILLISVVVPLLVLRPF